MSMQSKLTKTLLAMTAAATLFVALPSQAGQPYCPNPYVHGYGHGHGHVPPRRVVVAHRHHGHDRHDDRRGHDHRRDSRRDYHHVGRHEHRHDRHDRRHDRSWDRRDDRRDHHDRRRDN